MTSLTFPDINVWLALVTSEHAHHASATQWWEQETGRIGFSRLTQMGLLRLMTTAAAMDGKPLTMAEAWRGSSMSSNGDTARRWSGTGDCSVRSARGFGWGFTFR